MIKLYFMEINPLCSDGILDDMMLDVSSEKRERLLRYRHDIDRKIGIYSDVLIRCLISMTSGVAYSAIDMKTGRTGKPYLTCFPYCEFNISHTRNAVAAALSDKPVGVDIEKIRDIDVAIADRVFSENELSWLYDDMENRNIRFFDIWTKKEALVKRDGTGLSRNLKSFDVTGRSTYGELSTLTVDGYIISICSSTRFQVNDLITISEPELIEMWQRAKRTMQYEMKKDD